MSRRARGRQGSGDVGGLQAVCGWAVAQLGALGPGHALTWAAGDSSPGRYHNKVVTFRAWWMADHQDGGHAGSRGQGLWERTAGPGWGPLSSPCPPSRTQCYSHGTGPGPGSPYCQPHLPSLLSQQVPPGRGGRGPQRHPSCCRRHCPQRHVPVPWPAPRVPPAPRPFSRPNRQARGG